MEEAPINSKTGKAITKRILYIGKEVDSTKEETTRGAGSYILRLV